MTLERGFAQPSAYVQARNLLAECFHGEPDQENHDARWEERTTATSTERSHPRVGRRGQARPSIGRECAQVDGRVQRLETAQEITGIRHPLVNVELSALVADALELAVAFRAAPIEHGSDLVHVQADRAAPGVDLAGAVALRRISSQVP
jgi:hypothetical protein